MNLSQILRDRDDNLSSKRVLAFLAFALFAAGFLADQFTPHKASEPLMSDLMVIILGGLGMAAAEWFGKPK